MLESIEEIRRKCSKEMETDVVDGSSGGREAVVSFSGSFGKTGHRGIWKYSSEADSGGATARFRDENGLRFTGDPGDVEERPWVEEAARSCERRASKNKQLGLCGYF